MSAVSSPHAFTQPKVVEKVFSLPIVSDSYTYGVDRVSVLTTSLEPHLSSSLASLSSRLSSLPSLGEERLPELVTSRLHKVTGGVHYLDSTLCHCLDQLLVKVPSLTSPTPALYSSIREAAVSQLTLASTYLASFTLAQLVLKVSDTGMEAANRLLKLAPASCSSRCEHIVSGLKTVRGQVEQVRREGARVNGTQKMARMESSSLLSAVSEVFGLNYVLDFLGLAEIVAKASAPGEVSEEVVPEISEAAVEVVKEDVGETVEAAAKKDVPNEVEAAFEVVKEVMKAEAAAAVKGVERGVFGAAPVQKEGKKGKMSFKN